MPLLSEDALNDFFLPSQDCIKPVEIIKTNLDSEIKIDNGVHWEVSKDGTQTQLETASISLNDCLACSGCVTTAESVLIGLQSWSEVEATLKAAEKKIMVASVCPQSISSIAASFGISFESAFGKLSTLLKSLGFSQVLSTNIGREISLYESGKEFLDYYKDKSGSGPLLASACPGWICYAEKQKSSLIPTISKVRSPQQMTGVMFKDVLSREKDITRGDVYHVAIMPCFDKKLEASRQEFMVEEVRDVDTVITSAEVVSMMTTAGIDFLSLPEDSDRSFGPASGRQEGSSSGGYLAYIMVTAAKALFDMDISPSLEDDPHVKITRQRTPRLTEFELLDDSGKSLLTFAQAYGFRQITSLCQKLAPGTTADSTTRRARRPRTTTTAVADYAYIEIMACESGCINGGGQVRAPQGSVQRDWVDLVESKYRSEAPIRIDDTRVLSILTWWSGLQTDTTVEEDFDDDRPCKTTAATATGMKDDRLVSHEKMVTRYNEIPPLVNPLTSKW